MNKTIVLRRQYFSDKSTIGRLEWSEDIDWVSLEDRDLGLRSDMPLEELKAKKVYAETAIPYGTYEVLMQWSEKYKKLMPFLQNVPAYSGIMIHVGNKPIDTLGCLIIATYIGRDEVFESKKAFDAFYPLAMDWLGYELSATNKVWSKVNHDNKLFVEVTKDVITKRVV